MAKRAEEETREEERERHASSEGPLLALLSALRKKRSLKKLLRVNSCLTKKKNEFLIFRTCEGAWVARNTCGPGCLQSHRELAGDARPDELKDLDGGRCDGAFHYEKTELKK